MKRYTIGLITGILLTASAFMFLGATQKDSSPGRYQGMAQDHYLFLLDTHTGEVWSTIEWHKKKNWEKKERLWLK